MAAPIFKLYGEIGANTKPVEDALAKTKSALGATKDQLSSTVEKFTGLSLGALAAGGAVGALAIGLRKAWEAGREGAQLEYTALKFDRLTKAIGGTSKALLSDLKAATKGMRSDAELMQSATDIMALGLVKSQADVVRLSKVVGALNMDMNQLVLTLANKTTMRFDQLGVSVDGFEERLKNLTSSGMDANAAFSEAFLQQAEAQVAKVGSAADTNAGKIARMDAAFANLGDTLKLTLAPAVADVAEGITRAITAGETWEQSMERNRRSFLQGANSWEDYQKAINNTVGSQARYINEAGDLVTRNGYVIYSHYALSKAEVEAALATEQMADAFERERVQADRWTTKGKEVYQTEAQIQKALKDTRIAAEQTAAGFDEFSSALGANTQTAEWNKDALAASAKEIENLNFIIAGSIGETERKYKKDTASITSSIKDMETELKNLAKQPATPANVEKIDDLKKKLDEAKGSLQELQKEYDRSTKLIIFNMLQQKLASDGLTKVEIDNLTRLAEKWQLIDPATAAAAEAMNAIDLSQANAELSGIDGILGRIQGRPHDQTFTIRTNNITAYYEEWHYGEEGTKTGTHGLINAGGGSWIVPPGYQENYPLPGNRHASTGEKITVTPAGNVKTEGRDERPIQIIINGVDDPRMLARLVAREFQRR